MPDYGGLTKQTKCMTPKCNNKEAPQLKRGLCLQCYSKAKKLVESDKTTWDKLVELGLCRGDTTDPFTEAFNDKMKGE